MASEIQQSGAIERRDRMRVLIEERAFAGVAELSREFGVSAVTVRSDLDALEAEGGIRRIRGGAMPFDTARLRERSFEEAAVEAAEAKARIAAAAVDLLESGMSLLLDVGTTAAAVARELLRRDGLRELTVITNGLSIALLLEAAVPRLQVVVTGGTLRPLQHSLVAPLADQVLGRVRADLALIGCNGVAAEAGVTNINLPEAEVKAAMIAAAARTVVIADGSKIGLVQLGHVADASAIDMLITDPTAPAAALAELRSLGRPRIIVALSGQRVVATRFASRWRSGDDDLVEVGCVGGRVGELDRVGPGVEQQAHGDRADGVEADVVHTLPFELGQHLTQSALSMPLREQDHW
jgi:DeoR family transcriptional regulator, aga operon transcriptional repressor